LVFAIATPVLLLVVLGLVLGRQLLQMQDDADWVEHTDQVISTAHSTMRQIVDQETGIRGYLVTKDRLFLEPFERSKPLVGFNEIEALVGDNPAQQARFAEARRRYEDWFDLMRSIVSSSDLETPKTFDQMRERKDHMDAVREAMATAVDVEEGLRKARFTASAQSTERAKQVFVFLLVAVAGLLAFLSRSHLSSIARTFSAALEAEKETRRAMEDEAWIRTGQAELAAALQGEKTTANVGVDALQTLARYTQADIGAFFIKKDGAWQRRAGVALDSRAAGPEVFAEGEGIVGRAALEGKLLDLREVPADFLKLRSGTGEATPVQVVVVPAGIEGVSHAVLELGFLRVREARVLELLGRIGQNIALAVRSSEYKEMLRDLLEETQRQGEELQTQQEELKVQNEELEQQSKALQDSQERLENQQAELEQINSQLEEQAQTLEHQKDDLSRSQRELQRANDYKSEFLANMSHELRTPLNSSLILARLLAENRPGNLDAEQVKFAETIYSAGNDLLTLINDILDLSKIEAGKLDVRPEPISLARLIDELADGFKPIAQEKGLELVAVVEGQVPETITTDPVRLQQILKNLLSNALKFTEQGGVSMSVRRALDGRLAFEVKDTGIGIPHTQHEVIFEAFRQADGTTNRKYGGTGLGLSISRDLARLLGGELTLESTVGHGSTFTLSLPDHYASSEPARQLRPEPAASLPRRPRPAALPLPASAPSADVALDDRERLTTERRSILVIEDDPGFAAVLKDLAHELDFQTLLAKTAEEGLGLASRYKPSAIVLDVGLPDRSGLSVLDALKHDPVTRHIPVHVISGSDHTQTALEMGATGYAVKPIAREQLIDALKKLEAKVTQSVRRILVVEDDAVLRESTCRLLAGPDVEIVAVGTAREALEQLGASTFDCMVLDLTLPDRTGFELLEEMSQKEQYGFPPVIVYTGRSLSREEEHKLRRFSQSIIVKGARSPERLLDEVTLFLHQVESELPPDRQRMLRDARHRDAVFEGRRILVVEDDIRNIFALTSVLEPKGAKVEIARNGKEALRHLHEKPGVDLVLMDIMMPEMDGLECTREIRKQPALAKLPIIALTAKAMADDRDACRAAGTNDHIAKPLDVDKLLSLVRVWMPK
jgi:signal transduction histidine kinase/DNA-binding response OmpR family regulator/CHASE3 domain sensor protein